MNICSTCGGAIFPGNAAVGYVGPICQWGGAHPNYGPNPYERGHYTFTPNPLTEEDVRRIIREELERAKLGD